MTNSVLLIQSSDETNRAIGTGFVCWADEAGSYLLTCSHVLADVESAKIEGLLATVVADGASKNIDLALLYVEGLI